MSRTRPGRRDRGAGAPRAISEIRSNLASAAGSAGSARPGGHLLRALHHRDRASRGRGRSLRVRRGPCRQRWCGMEDRLVGGTRPPCPSRRWSPPPADDPLLDLRGAGRLDELLGDRPRERLPRERPALRAEPRPSADCGADERIALELLVEGGQVVINGERKRILVTASSSACGGTSSSGSAATARIATEPSRRCQPSTTIGAPPMWRRRVRTPSPGAHHAVHPAARGQAVGAGRRDLDLECGFEFAERWNFHAYRRYSYSRRRRGSAAEQVNIDQERAARGHVVALAPGDRALGPLWGRGPWRPP